VLRYVIEGSAEFQIGPVFLDRPTAANVKAVAKIGKANTEKWNWHY
jgi:hypothetical protein